MNATDYTQRNAQSCGPDLVAAIVQQFGISREAVDRAWGIKDISKFANLQDTPWNHFNTVWSLGLPIQLISSAQILRGEAVNDRTCILIHNSTEPETRNIFSGITGFVQANLQEHWVGLQCVSDGRVGLYLGNGKAGYLTFDKFRKAMDSGVVRCAYVIGKGRMYLPLQARVWAWLTGKFS